MELYLLRHAIAYEQSEVDVKSDSERPLSPDGIKKMKKAAQGMKRLELTFDRVVSSPYVRARHTAEIAAEGVGFKKTVQFSDALTPEADVKSFFALLRGFGDDERVLLAGHEPTISLFISVLVSQKWDADVEMKKGSLCRIDLTDAGKPRGRLKWLLTSKQLRQIV
jgi:phosphohistidine phosphatase